MTSSSITRVNFVFITRVFNAINIRVIKIKMKINKTIIYLETFLILSLRHGAEKTNQICGDQGV